MIGQFNHAEFVVWCKANDVEPSGVVEISCNRVPRECVLLAAQVKSNGALEVRMGALLFCSVICFLIFAGCY